MIEFRNWQEDHEYNALVDAAPDLLAACEAIRDAMDNDPRDLLLPDDLADAYDRVVAAIAKAREGEA